ncbi:MAG: response regulator, partial [Planctomycetota bacterium]
EKISFRGSVLVAEDVLTNQKLIKRLLGKLGIKPKIVDDGQKAVKAASNRNFDLIFMDIQMPNMNGLEAAKLLREKGIKTPIVALTANALKGDDKKCIQAGCSDYMSKPIKREMLLRFLGKYLKREGEDMADKINQVKAQVDELTDFYEAESSQDNRTVADSKDDDFSDVIDFSDLAERGMDKEIIIEVVPLFISDNKIQLENLASAVKKGDENQIRSLAHAIKGASANVGAARIAELALKLEKKASSKDLSDAQELLDKIRAEYRRLKSLVSNPGWLDIAEEFVK